MAIFLRLAGLVQTQILGTKFGSGGFEQPTLVENLTWLWAEFGFVFFMKVIVLCHSFLMVQKLGHLYLSRPIYGQMNKHIWSFPYSGSVPYLDLT